MEDNTAKMVEFLLENMFCMHPLKKNSSPMAGINAIINILTIRLFKPSTFRNLFVSSALASSVCFIHVSNCERQSGKFICELILLKKLIKGRLTISTNNDNSMV